MIDGLPQLPVMGVGSYAVPGWYIAAQRQMKEGIFGPHDIEEATNDAVRVIVQDQIEAGLDVISDGEVRRQRFVYEMFQLMNGLKRVPAERKLGIAGYDMAPRFTSSEPVSAPGGLHLGDELEFLKSIAGSRPIKMALPGPLTFAMRIQPQGRPVPALLDEIVDVLRAEVASLNGRGIALFQLDEPSLPRPVHGLSLTEAAEVSNCVLDAFDGYTALHVCFGNNAGRPFADRRFERLMAAMQSLHADQLVLEFANREMAEIDLLAELSQGFDIAAGLVDVKNYHVETPDDVARRIDQTLKYVSAERLSVTADCGFSALPRYIARQKMQAMVDGTKLVRSGL